MAMYPSHRLLILAQIDNTLTPPVYLHPCQCAKITATLNRLCSHKQESARIFGIKPLVTKALASIRMYSCNKVILHIYTIHTPLQNHAKDRSAHLEHHFSVASLCPLRHILPPVLVWQLRCLFHISRHGAKNPSGPEGAAKFQKMQCLL